MSGLRRPLDIVWPVSAGVVALTDPFTSSVDLAGVLFAIAAAAGWASYIVLTQRVGNRFPGLQGLALSMTAAAVRAAAVPGVLAGTVGELTPWVLLITASTPPSSASRKGPRSRRRCRTRHGT